MLTKKQNNVTAKYLDYSGDRSAHGFWVPSDKKPGDAEVDAVLDAAQALSDADLKETDLSESFAWDGGTPAAALADEPYADNKLRLAMDFATNAQKKVTISVPGPKAPVGRFGNDLKATTDAPILALSASLIAIATTRSGNAATTYIGGRLRGSH